MWTQINISLINRVETVYMIKKLENFNMQALYINEKNIHCGRKRTLKIYETLVV